MDVNSNMPIGGTPNWVITQLTSRLVDVPMSVAELTRIAAEAIGIRQCETLSFQDNIEVRGNKEGKRSIGRHGGDMSANL